METPTTALRIAAVVSGLVGILCCALVPLLPVEQKTSTLQWPQGQPLTQSASVTAPATALVAQTFAATIPCDVLRSAPTDSTILATIPNGANQGPDKRLAVTRSADTVTVVVRQFILTSATGDALAGCRELVLSADVTGVSAEFVGASPAARQGPDKRPQIDGLFTSLTPEQVRAAGPRLSATIVFDTRFESSPSGLKLLALVIGAMAVIASLVSLALLDRVHGYARRVGRRRRLRLRPVDGVVALVLNVWLFIGGGSPDDGYISVMARIIPDAGYVTNYFRFYGIAEAPFDWYYSLLSLWASVSDHVLWLRIPGVFAGIASWLLLSRIILPRLGPAVTRSPYARWAAAAVLLAWWLPYAAGLRVEPIIVLGTLATWAAVESAAATRRMVPAALAPLLAGLTLALGPQGVVALALLLVSSRAMLAVAVRRHRESGVLAIAAPLIAVPAGLALVVFRDQTLAGLYDAVTVRWRTGPTSPWVNEYFRYYFLTLQYPDGTLSRRLPLLLLLASAIVVLVVLLRRTRIPGIATAPAWRAVGAVFAGIVLLAFDPVKWTIHFGVFAGLGAALAALVTVAVAAAGARRGGAPTGPLASGLAGGPLGPGDCGPVGAPPRRAPAPMHSARNTWLYVTGLGLLLAATAAGKNGWPWLVEWSVPWYDDQPVIAGRSIANAMLVLTAGAGIITAWLHLRGERPAPDPDSGPRVLAPARRVQHWARDHAHALSSLPTLVVAATMVLALLAVFARTSLVRADGYSIAGANIAAVTGDSCDLAEKVMVERDPNEGRLHSAQGLSDVDALEGKAPGNRPTVGFTANGVMPDLTPEPSATRAGRMHVAAKLTRNYTIEGAYSGTAGGTTTTPGVNGSTAALPFQLDPKRTPVMGSHGFDRDQAFLTTGWYDLPQLGGDKPILVVTAAGTVWSVDAVGKFRYGQKLVFEFGRKNPDGTFLSLGEITPRDVGPNRPWRNLRVPADQVPAGADAVRIVLEDRNLDGKQWLAITPPRVPVLSRAQDLLGTTDPVLLDFTAAAQFPCQRPFRVTAGVAEVPRWRVMPSWEQSQTASKTWMASEAGGPLAVTEALTTPDSIATYLQGDWGRDWGNIERLTPLVADAAPARLNVGATTRFGWWRSGAMRIEVQQ